MSSINSNFRALNHINLLEFFMLVAGYCFKIKLIKSFTEHKTLPKAFCFLTKISGNVLPISLLV